MAHERPVRVERRLAAILVADVAGYSRLMHRNEEDTHARLTSLLTEAVHPAIAEHGGRIARSGAWRPVNPIDGDHHFRSMTTTCSGRWRPGQQGCGRA